MKQPKDFSFYFHLSLSDGSGVEQTIRYQNNINFMDKIYGCEHKPGHPINPSQVREAKNKHIYKEYMGRSMAMSLFFSVVCNFATNWFYFSSLR